MTPSAPDRVAPTPPWAWIGLALLVLLFATLTLAASPRKSASFDEQYHLAAGYSYLKTGDFRLATTHPPLIGMLAALPLLADDSIVLPLDHPTWAAGNRFDFSDYFLWYANAEPASMLERARAVIVVLGVLLVASVFLWGKALFGPLGALLAAALVALDPNILANARQVTTDLGVTLFALLALWRLWAWLERDRWWDILLVGMCAGAAMTAKYNGLLVWPAIVVVLLIHPKAEASLAGRIYWRRLLALLIAGVVALVVVWGVYRFDVGPVTIASFTLPVPALFFWTHLWQTLTGLMGENATKPDFLLGQVSTGGWWYYFPVAILVKTPLPLLILVVTGLAALFRSHGTRRHAAVWVPPLLFAAMALTGLLTIGYRHLLPALPFVCLLAGNNIRWFDAPRRRVAIVTVALLIGWLAASALWFFPNHDSYFNELAGRWPHWSEILVDSNLDWGQDLPALREVMQQRGIERVELAYFGKAAPEAYGVAYAPLPGYLRFMGGRELNAYNPVAPEPGWYAISATSLRLGDLQPGGLDLYAYFRNRTPDARAGYSIYLYDVTAEDVAAPRPLLLTGEAAYRAAPATLTGDDWRAQVRWRGSDSTSVEPDAGAPASVPGFHAVGADLGGVFTLEGYTLKPESPVAGEALHIDLYWRRGVQPMQMPAPTRGEPISAFVHVIDGAPSNVVAQFDGWDVALRGLQEGDRIIQPVEISLPPDMDRSRSYRILAGLYSPQDGSRLSTVAAAGESDAVDLGELRLAP